MPPQGPPPHQGPPYQGPPQGGPYPPPQPPFHPGYRAPVPGAPTEGKAVTSFILGLLSIFCFGILTGLPAVIVGLMSRRDIARSGNTLAGGGLALGGVITGAAGSLLSLITIGMMLFGMFAAARGTSSFTPPPVVTVPPAVPAIPTARNVGDIQISEIHAQNGTLREQLLDARSEAAKAGRTLLVEVRAKWCGATCSALDAALLDPRMQHALNDVRLLRIDLDEFSTELAPLSMLTREVPYFYKIDSSANVLDSLSADAWDDNTPANMAPVFGAFLRGELHGDSGAPHGTAVPHGGKQDGGAHGATPPHSAHGKDAGAGAFL